MEKKIATHYLRELIKPYIWQKIKEEIELFLLSLTIKVIDSPIAKGGIKYNIKVQTQPK